MIAFERDFRDLNLIAQSRRRPLASLRFLPLLLVPGAVGVEFEGFFERGRRVLALAYSELRSRTRADLFVVGELVAGVQDAALKRDQSPWRRIDSSASRAASSPLRTGTFHSARTRTSSTRGREQARFRSIVAAAPKISGFPYELILRYSDCKTAEFHPEERQCGVPAEMHSDRQPQIVRAQQRDAEEHAETGRVDHAERGRARDSKRAAARKAPRFRGWRPTLRSRASGTAA